MSKKAIQRGSEKSRPALKMSVLYDLVHCNRLLEDRVDALYQCQRQFTEIVNLRSSIDIAEAMHFDSIYVFLWQIHSAVILALKSKNLGVV